MSLYHYTVNLVKTKNTSFILFKLVNFTKNLYTIPINGEQVILSMKPRNTLQLVQMVSGAFNRKVQAKHKVFFNVGKAYG